MVDFNRNTPTSRADVEKAIADAKARLPRFEALFPDDDRPRLAIEAAEMCLDDELEYTLAKGETTAAIGGATQAATEAMLVKESAATAEEAAWKASLAAVLAARFVAGEMPE